MMSIGNRTTSLLAKPASLPPGFLLQHRRLSFLSLSRSRCPLPLSLPRAANNRRGKSAAMAGLEMDEDEDAKEWPGKKPRGFGDGKEYDTSIEDKLAEEIERSRRAQAANIAFLKANPASSGPNSPKDIGLRSEDFRVRVFNLPKKKNVGRDLKAAFQEVPGLISIVPAVSGNKKTKDPICKGFAFVYFKSKEDAARFARQFSGEAIAFGKIQKEIKCQVMSSQSANSTTVYKDTVAKLPILAGESDDGFAGSDLSFEITTFVEFDEDGDDEEDDIFDDGFAGSDLSFEITTFVEFDEDGDDEEDDIFDDDFIEAEFKDVTRGKESLSISKSNGNATMQPGTKNAASSSKSPKNQQDKNRASKKKVTPKGKKPKHLKLDIPGSAKRLKVKDKAVLTEVFDKYASQAAMAAKPEPQR